MRSAPVMPLLKKKRPAVRSKSLLLDLDGTLLDTAPDITAALNRLLIEAGKEPLDIRVVRQCVPNGVAALVRLAFGKKSGEEMERLSSQFLELYEQNISVETKLFDGFEDLLLRVEQESIPWGVVTNKAGVLTAKLLAAQRLASRASCVVSGDTVSRRKPDPQPLLHAAALIDRSPADCVYVGDSERDIQAGRAAGMTTLVARYGYIPDGVEPNHWHADGSINSPRELLAWLQLSALK